MDELAARVKADPVQYRLRHLRDPRLVEVVKAAAKGAGWETRPSPRGGRPAGGVSRGRGVACVLYEGDNGYCAMVAEVEVDQASGQISVTRLVASQDCGPISSPDGMKNQIEGGALQGMSRALGEAVTWDATKVTSIDWRTYHSLTMGAKVPTIESVLINRPDQEAMGAGETTIIPPKRDQAFRSALLAACTPAASRGLVLAALPSQLAGVAQRQREGKGRIAFGAQRRGGIAR
jgi:CO/xanthine dehydrogenase Mo-binding subunit